MATDDEWHERWREGRIGFHLSHVNPTLVRFLPRLAPSPTRVLVPLCGKSLDLRYLAEQGHDVVGVELVEQAARDFFDENGIAATRDHDDGGVVYRGDGVEIHVADMLQVSAETLGLVGAIYDRAALVALSEEERSAYAQRLLQLLPSGCRMLLSTLAYDQTRVDGPPYSVSGDEVTALYGHAGVLERVEHDPSTEGPPRFKELGLALSESTWLLTRG